MNLLRNPLRLGLATLALLAPVALLAAEPKPVAVISMASVDETLADVGYLTTVTGMEDAGKMVRLFGAALTSGMDKKRPAGAFVVPLAGEFPTVAFIPVTDLKQLLTIHKEYIGEPSDEGDGVQKVGLSRTAFIKEQNGWVFIAESKDHLVDLPADPSKLLGDLPTRYNLAGKVLVQNIPQEFRQMVIDEIKFGLERGLDAPAIGRGDRDSIEQAARTSLAQIERYLNEAEEVSLGWAIDAPTRRTYIDINVIAREGTALAKQMSQQTAMKSNFAGLKLPQASVTINIATKVAEADLAQIKGMIGGIREQLTRRIDDDPNLAPDKRGVAKDILGQLFDHLEKSWSSGVADGGAALVLEAESINLVAGGLSADGKELEAILKKVADLAKNEPNFPAIQFNAGKHGNVDLHKLSAPIPAHEAEARNFLGEKLDVVIGTGPKAVYLAAGKSGESLLKSALDRTPAAAETPIPPMQVEVALLPLLKFLSSVDDNPELPEVIALLEQTGNDRLLITSQPLPRGGQVRIELQEGLLRIIGKLVERFSGEFRDLL
ncbi:MAG: hypothetical protein SFU86_18800 [Pirellulaceae bacterium]|nr:hypothetical protein [Pirellulaceae bacterium]